VGDEDASQSDSAEDLSRAGYADFFARVAHDLRSPLGIVMHVMQKLEGDLGAQLTDEQRTLMKLGTRGVRRLQSFVDRVGLLSDLESDELEVNLQPVDLGQVVERTVEACVTQEPRSGLEVSYEPTAVVCTVMGDPVLLPRLLRELLSNAVAHARRKVKVGIVAEAATASVFIEDDGAGVAPAARGVMYRRFVVRDAHGGLGIGLSMARDLTRAHAGELRLERSSLPPGRPDTVGARFVLTLPYAVAST
jgi:signal transduction histidine kinase